MKEKQKGHTENCYFTGNLNICDCGKPYLSCDPVKLSFLKLEDELPCLCLFEEDFNEQRLQRRVSRSSTSKAGSSSKSSCDKLSSDWRNFVINCKSRISWNDLVNFQKQKAGFVKENIIAFLQKKHIQNKTSIKSKVKYCQSSR